MSAYLLRSISSPELHLSLTIPPPPSTKEGEELFSTKQRTSQGYIRLFTGVRVIGKSSIFQKSNFPLLFCSSWPQLVMGSISGQNNQSGHFSHFYSWVTSCEICSKSLQHHECNSGQISSKENVSFIITEILLCTQSKKTTKKKPLYQSVIKWWSLLTSLDVLIFNLLKAAQCIVHFVCPFSFLRSSQRLSKLPKTTLN